MRKSSGEDEHGSLARQRQAIRSWAKHNNVTLAPEVWEPRVSGSKHWKQRGLGQAIAACERGEAAGIVCEEQSRLSRENGLATAEVWDALERAGLRLVCAAEGLDTGNGGDQELSFTIKGALAREQWKQFKRRSEASKKHAVEVLGIPIGPVPYGYTRELHEPLRLDPKQSKLVRAVFQLRADGAPLNDVVRFLDRKAPGGRSGVGVWQPGTVAGILRNRVYLGEARGGGYVKPGAHPAIVDQQTFDAVQALARKPQRAPAVAKSLLAGSVRCLHCGYAFEYKTVAGGYTVYRCSRRSATGDCPAPSGIMVHALDEYVEAKVRERLADQTIEQVTATRDVDAIHRRLATARAKREPFVDPDYVALLGPADASRGLRKANEEIAEVEAELADALTDDQGIVGVVGVQDALDALASLDINARRAVVQSMLDGVFVSKAPRGTPVADRATLVWRGDPLPIPRPSRGRRARPEVEPRVQPA
jgi:DNA invertase Pin-like site-specific DNA recombinase